MRAPTALIAILSASSLVSSPVVLADSWKDESGHGRERGGYEYKREYEAGGCKYEYKSGPDGYKEERKCEGYAGGPPSWAPAHGYRRKHGHRERGYAAPTVLDLSAGRCDRELIGRVLGGAAGAAVGSQIGDGDGRLVAIIGGAAIGVLVGGSVGRSMDRADYACVDHALEYAPSGQPVAWQNPDGENYQVTPQRTYQTSAGGYCREYTATATVGGRSQQTYGTACRQPDGSWRLVN